MPDVECEENKLFPQIYKNVLIHANICPSADNSEHYALQSNWNELSDFIIAWSALSIEYFPVQPVAVLFVRGTETELQWAILTATLINDGYRSTQSIHTVENIDINAAKSNSEYKHVFLVLDFVTDGKKNYRAHPEFRKGVRREIWGSLGVKPRIHVVGLRDYSW